MKKYRFSVLDGMLRRNAVLAQGMVIAPIVVCCNTLINALVLSLAFALITFLTVCIASFYPKKIVYAARIILYALTAAAVYIPVAFLIDYINPDVQGELLGLYLPLLAVNSFIVLHSELYFYRMRRRIMWITLFFHIVGFCLTAAAVGAVRELLAFGTLAGHLVDMPLVMQGTAAPWAGFVLLGVLCALHRRLFPKK